MTAKCSSAGKHLAAHVAFKAFLASVHCRVDFQINSRQEPFTTDLAQVGLFPGVNPQMRVQIALAHEKLVANCARVLSVVRSRVDLLVALAEALRIKTICLKKNY